MSSRLLNFFLVLSVTSGAAVAQDSSLAPSQIDTLNQAITAFLAEQHAPGVSVAIVKDGKLAWTGAYGFSDLENSVPAKTSTMYRLASISKPITATAVMQLAEAGKLDLDAPIQKYCPAYPEKQWPISARELLGHLAGVRHYKQGDEWRSTRHYSSITESLDFFKADPLEHEPGTKYQYSTFGFSLLGCAVEGASGMKFMDYLQEKVFRPAAMEHIQTDDTFTLIPNRARGYRKTEKGEVVNTWLADTSNKIPGGGMIATATDLADFAIATMHATLVSRATLEKMWSPQTMRDGQKTGSGLDWEIGELRGHRSVSHSGGQPGTSTDLILLPQINAAVAVMVNMDEVPASALAETILKDFVPN
jgi:serine beta-lactamase-like protein LACTB, mitochondrial